MKCNADNKSDAINANSMLAQTDSVCVRDWLISHNILKFNINNTPTQIHIHQVLCHIYHKTSNGSIHINILYPSIHTRIIPQAAGE